MNPTDPRPLVTYRCPFCNGGWTPPAELGMEDYESCPHCRGRFSFATPRALAVEPAPMGTRVPEWSRWVDAPSPTWECLRCGERYFAEVDMCAGWSEAIRHGTDALRHNPVHRPASPSAAGGVTGAEPTFAELEADHLRGEIAHLRDYLWPGEADDSGETVPPGYVIATAIQRLRAAAAEQPRTVEREPVAWVSPERADGMVNVNLGDSLLVAGLHHTEAQAVVRAINRAAVSEYPVAWLIDPAGQGKPYLTLHDASKPAFWDGGKIPEGYVVKPLFAGTPLFAVVAPEGSPVERDECPKCGNHCLRPDKSCPSCSPVASEEAAKPIASTVFRDLTGDDWTPKPAAPVESEEA